MKMEQTECSETSAYKIQTPGNYPEESIQQVFVYHQQFCTSSLEYFTVHLKRCLVEASAELLLMVNNYLFETYRE